ncbi:MAG: hypothetical protein E7233_07165 [Lachnospiraceae bacterium]|nr:hypothetical protein [Lachnospiraceae bacterium]
MKKIIRILAAAITAIVCLVTIFRVPAQAADINIAAYMNYGGGDVLFYTTDYSGWASGFPSTGGKWPAYCIDHEKYGPWTGNMFYSGPTVSQQNRLGYVFRNGYPNKDWGLSGPEAQYLTQAAVFGIMSGHSAMYELQERVHSPAWIYADVFGYSYTEDSWSKPGNFWIAEYLYNSAVSGASSADAQYCMLFEPYNTTAYLQRMAVPVPASGSLRVRKASGADTFCVTDNAAYSLGGAVYGVYSDPSCSRKEGELTTGEDGASGYIDLTPGTYYIKELSPSKGFKLNPETEVAQIQAGDSKTLDVTEPVEGDPVALNIIKESANGGGSVKLQGAEFTLTYTFTGHDGSERSMQLVYASNENGVINLQSTSYLVSGDPYTDPATGAIVFFAGHITVRETKAPEGFIADEDFELNADLSVDDEGNISLIYDAGDLTIENESIHVVNVPEIKVTTSARDEENGTQEATLGTGVIITDLVTVRDAVIGEQVELSGYPVFRSSFTDRDGTEYAAGDAVPFDGDRSVEHISYTAEAEEEIKELRFCLDTVRLNGAEIVLFTDVTAGIALDSHHDMEDADEFINVPYLPSMGTAARDEATGDHVGSAGESSVIIDEVMLSGLIPGTVYTLEGTLVYKDTFEDADGVIHSAGDAVPCGQGSTGNVTFTATEADMTEELRFSVDPNELAGRDVVAFEYLYCKGVLFASHDDIEDFGQTVSYPQIHTELTDLNKETHFMHADEEITLIDVVTYENLIPGETYLIEGKLVNAETGEPLTDDMYNPIVSGTGEFVPEERNGTVQIAFTFAGKNLEGITAVAFERLLHGETKAAIHEDTEDEGQTVYFAGIETSLNGKCKKEAMAEKKATLTDTVKYRNLDITHEYELTGVLTDRETGEPLVDDNGKEIQGSARFSPKTPDGTEDVVFSFDASKLAGRSVTAFEELHDLDLDLTVAVHKEKGSPSQTVSFPNISTTLSGSGGEKALEAVKREITLKDKVRFENLIPGKEYTLSGILMDKETNAPAVDGKGKQITAEAKFTPGSPSGETELTFTFKAAGLEGKSLVAFETLKNESGEVAVHADINDAAQTVTFNKPSAPATGDTAKTLIWILLATASALAAGGLIIYMKRRAEKEK